MAGEYLVINPRRRRRRKARAHGRRRRRHRRVRNDPGMSLNPRRRRRRRSARRHGRRRHYARNPRLLGGVNLGHVIGVSVGFIGTEVATPFITRLIPAPADANTGKLLNLGIKAGVGVFAIPMLLRMLPGTRRFAGPFAIGAGVAVIADLWASYVAPALKLGDYQMAQLADYDQTAPGALMGDTAFGESIYSPAAY